MKMKPLSLSVLAASTFALTFWANAESTLASEAKIFVYQECTKLAEIKLNEEQFKAYKNLKENEHSFEDFEKPTHEMEKELAFYEEKLEKLSDQLVSETEDKLVVNKALVKEHKEIAEQMKRIVDAHKPHITAIEQRAERLSLAAKEFERLIKPSIKEFDGDNIQIHISNNENLDRCRT